VKNLMGKSRKPGNAYVTLRDPRIGWTWEVLKAWQADGSKPFARVFCNVHGFETEMGDVYVKDVGRELVDYDRTVFASGAEAIDAVFGRAS
jgi:hypothetical protein